ncbi:MAG TPA: acylglycerol kinase family protein, partial [Longimicrobiales bacterium]
MPPCSIHVILNPVSRAGRAGRDHANIVRALHSHGIDPLVHLTQHAGHALQIAHDIALTGADIIAAAGGDGTVHDVANGILRAQSSTALAVIPLGTGNDFAKIVPGAQTSRAALETLAHPQIRRYDVGHATWLNGDEFFVNGMGTGIDVEVVRQLARTPHAPGPVKYLLALLRALAVYEPITLSARFDNHHLERRV